MRREGGIPSKLFSLKIFLKNGSKIGSFSVSSCSSVVLIKLIPSSSNLMEYSEESKVRHRHGDMVQVQECPSLLNIPGPRQDQEGTMVKRYFTAVYQAHLYLLVL